MLTHARAYGYNIREAQEFQSVRRLYLSHVLPPPPALAAHVSACVSSSNHASPAPSPTASASAHGLEVLEQPEAVGRVGLGPALDREEVEARRGLLALLKELRREQRGAVVRAAATEAAAAYSARRLGFERSGVRARACASSFCCGSFIRASRYLPGRRGGRRLRGGRAGGGGQAARRPGRRPLHPCAAMAPFPPFPPPSLP